MNYPLAFCNVAQDDSTEDTIDSVKVVNSGSEGSVGNGSESWNIANGLAV